MICYDIYIHLNEATYNRQISLLFFYSLLLSKFSQYTQEITSFEFQYMTVWESNQVFNNLLNFFENNFNFNTNLHLKVYI